MRCNSSAIVIISPIAMSYGTHMGTISNPIWITCVFQSGLHPIPHLVSMWYSHMGSIWFTYGIHMVQQCGYYVVTTWILCGNYMDNMCISKWFAPDTPSGFHVVQPYGFHMVYIWYPYGATMWLLCGNYISLCLGLHCVATPPLPWHPCIQFAADCYTWNWYIHCTS